MCTYKKESGWKKIGNFLKKYFFCCFFSEKEEDKVSSMVKPLEDVPNLKFNKKSVRPVVKPLVVEKTADDLISDKDKAKCREQANEIEQKRIYERIKGGDIEDVVFDQISLKTINQLMVLKKIGLRKTSTLGF